MAAARNVSAAASTTRRPSARSRAASLPMVVVLPVPLTPDDQDDRRRALGGRDGLPVLGVAVREQAASSSRTACSAVTSRRLRARSTRSIENAAPTSPVIRVSSISSQSAPPSPPNALRSRAPKPGPGLLEARLELCRAPARGERRRPSRGCSRRPTPTAAGAADRVRAASPGAGRGDGLARGPSSSVRSAPSRSRGIRRGRRHPSAGGPPISAGSCELLRLRWAATEEAHAGPPGQPARPPRPRGPRCGGGRRWPGPPRGGG